MTPEQFIELRNELTRQIVLLTEQIDAAKEEADKCPPPENRRRATAADIVEGAIIWHENPDGWYWHEVDDVRHPNDDFQAYVSNGDLYGLHGAWVGRHVERVG